MVSARVSDARLGVLLSRASDVSRARVSYRYLFERGFAMRVAGCPSLAPSIHVLVAVLGLFPAWARGEEPRPRRLIYNADGSCMFIHVKPPMQPADLDRYVDEIAEYGCTSLFMSVNNGMTTNYPGKVIEMSGTYLTQEQNEFVEKVAQEKTSTNERGLANMRALIAAGHDPIRLIVDRARQKKLEVFTSFRMNEVHLCNEPDKMPAPLLISKYWREHPEWRIGTPGDPLNETYTNVIGPRRNPAFGWLQGGLNYALPEVRKLRLAQLRECCERFNVDGLDLDFMRFPMYFRPGEEAANVPVMTAFVREVRDMTRDVGRARGRPLLLSVRVPQKPELSQAIGLDAIGWAKADLVDMVAAGHFLRPTSEVAIREYRAALPASVPLYGSIDLHGTDFATRTAEHRKMARQYYRDGADGVYVYNFFTTRERGSEPDWPVLRELGDPRKIPPE